MLAKLLAVFGLQTVMPLTKHVWTSTLLFLLLILESGTVQSLRKQWSVMCYILRNRHRILFHFWYTSNIVGSAEMFKPRKHILLSHNMIPFFFNKSYNTVQKAVYAGQMIQMTCWARHLLIFKEFNDLFTLHSREVIQNKWKHCYLLTRVEKPSLIQLDPKHPVTLINAPHSTTEADLYNVFKMNDNRVWTQRRLQLLVTNYELVTHSSWWWPLFIFNPVYVVVAVVRQPLKGLSTGDHECVHQSVRCPELADYCPTEPLAWLQHVGALRYRSFSSRTVFLNQLERVLGISVLLYSIDALLKLCFLCFLYCSKIRPSDASSSLNKHFFSRKSDVTENADTWHMLW